ncbi:1-acyl-sn-glycerol-3-phosphate acyltransferase [Moraxella pluranimalium]|uniref:Glycerol acyltransferase n=1 Tax=Moraxella pluranimalium TaxID=470453 RepID=A0A1T0CBV7_9GAMM|nr:1-acyl-sn-glycerol-3-phosphate acyltransferase [Moraxella pluranimalium]OOS19816.1 glycerol acyltransferase [Moraxella pluranimalium]
MSQDVSRVAQLLPKFSYDALGSQLPRRHRPLATKMARRLLAMLGWRLLGRLPDVPQAVIIGAPHTSNVDGVPAILTMLALGLDIKVMGKKQLFSVPILSQFLTWVGVIAIDRDKKGSVLQANIDRFATGEPLLLALAPEGTRQYTESFRTGFYYLAMGAGVPIIPVALDYPTKTVRFLDVCYPTGDYQADLAGIIKQYHGVVGYHPSKMAKILQDA